MNSNRLYNIFKSSRLSREDVEVYNSSNDSVAKNAIEQKANSDKFNNEAFEGWSENDFDASLMKTLDKKFLSKTKILSVKSISLTVIFALIISIAFIYNQNFNTIDKSKKINSDQQLSSSKMIIEETDIMLPQLIEEMTNAPINKQITPKKIISEFAEMKLNEEEAPVDIDKLPIKTIDSKKDVSIVSKRKEGKEIYLSELKLVDYKPLNAVIKTKQVQLTGTPASMENESSEDIEAQWKTIQVPYIEYIEKSLRILNNGNYKKALSRFETVLKDLPDDVNSNFYSGYCLFNLSEYNVAIVYFQKCISGVYSNFDEESEWMLAQCYLLNGKKDKAKKQFQRIIERDGFYANQAKAKISQ